MSGDNEVSDTTVRKLAFVVGVVDREGELWGKRNLLARSGETLVLVFTVLYTCEFVWGREFLFRNCREISFFPNVEKDLQNFVVLFGFLKEISLLKTKNSSNAKMTENSWQITLCSL
jgi:hypothetical protein